MVYYFEPVKGKYRIYWDGTYNYVIEKFKKGIRSRGKGIGGKFSGWYLLGYFPSIHWMLDSLAAYKKIIKNKPYALLNPESHSQFESFGEILDKFKDFDVHAEGVLMRNDPNRTEMSLEHKKKIATAAKSRKGKKKGRKSSNG